MWTAASAAGALVAAIVSLGALAYLLVASPLIGQSLMWLFVGAAQWTTLRILDPSVHRFGIGTAIGVLGGIGVGLPVAIALPLSGLYAPMVVLIGAVAAGAGLGQGIALTDGLVRRNPAIALHLAASGLGAMLGAVAGLWVGAYVLGADFASLPGTIATVAGASAVGGGVYGLVSGWTVGRILTHRSRSSGARPPAEGSVQLDPTDLPRALGG